MRWPYYLKLLIIIEIIAMALIGLYALIDWVVNS